jgi:ubiquinone/menaquinone biosynthesis C-methylase UbiE
MTNFSRFPITFFYDFFEKYIIKDYQTALQQITNQLSLKESDILVDIGGGTGFILNKISKQIKIGMVVDISKKMLLRIKSNTECKIQADALSLPFNDDSISTILLINVLHHIDRSNHQLLFNELYRILKNNGVIFIMDLYYPMNFLNTVYTLFEELACGKTFHISYQNCMVNIEMAGFIDPHITFLGKNKWTYTIKAKKQL